MIAENESWFLIIYVSLNYSEETGNEQNKSISDGRERRVWQNAFESVT